MERIQAAIQKAKEQRGAVIAPSPGVGGGMSRGPRTAQIGPAWAELAATTACSSSWTTETTPSLSLLCRVVIGERDSAIAFCHLVVVVY